MHPTPWEYELIYLRNHDLPDPDMGSGDVSGFFILDADGLEVLQVEAPKDMLESAIEALAERIVNAVNAAERV